MQPARALVLAHRSELIYQAQDKIQRVTGLDAQVEMAEYRADTHSLMGLPPVVVSTIQTQTAGGDGGGRMTKFNPMDFGVLVIDEGHHAVSASYRRCIKWYVDGNPDLKILGVTATPDRQDEEALGQVFGDVAFDYETLNAIDDGWLVPVEQHPVHIEGIDLSNCGTVAGDFNGADLAEVMEDDKVLMGMADVMIDIAGKRRGIVFCASVVEAERGSEIMNRPAYRPGCSAWVCGKTDKDARRKILSDFASGAIQFLWNVGVLTEGFDDAGVEIVFMGRPTKSRALYAQMLGRGTRPAESVAHLLNDVPDAEARRAMIAGSIKPSCEIIDFVGNAGRHKLITPADILGGNYSDEVIAEVTRRAQESSKPVNVSDALKAAQKAIEAKKKMEAFKRAALTAKAKYSMSTVNPFDVFDISPAMERGWDKGKHLSEKQAAILMKQGIDPSALPYGQAKQLLNETFRRWGNGLASFKQAQHLKRHGFTAPMRRDEAARALDRVFGNRRGAA